MIRRKQGDRGKSGWRDHPIAANRGGLTARDTQVPKRPSVALPDPAELSLARKKALLPSEHPHNYSSKTSFQQKCAGYASWPLYQDLVMRGFMVPLKGSRCGANRIGRTIGLTASPRYDLKSSVEEVPPPKGRGDRGKTPTRWR